MKRMLYIIPAIILVLVLSLSLTPALPAAAQPPNEVWVAPGGSDNNTGTEAKPFATIQMGIDTVAPEGTVHVAAGTYAEHLNWSSKDITIIGSGSDNCTIDGTNTGRVIYTSGLTSAAKLEGFTITSGYTSQGGGMYNDNSSPTISSCNFSGNSATGGMDAYGGGMYNSSSYPTITSCNFSDNSVTGTFAYGGGMCNYCSSPNITSCTFNGNSATGVMEACGGGMCNYGSSPNINNCTFKGNSATDTFLPPGSAYGGGMYNIGSSPTITNCTFNSNYVSCPFAYGGGMYNDFSSPTITNCTFYGNSATTSGGGMYNDYDCSPTITNCILWGDTGGEIYNYDPLLSSPVVTYSDVQWTGVYTGTGNINADPLFVDAGSGDFHLKSKGGHWTSTGWFQDNETSPCIDAGDPNSDYTNEPEPNGGRINMGAYGNTAQASLAPVLIVTTESDVGEDSSTQTTLDADTGDGGGLSLREALDWAGTGDTVTFSSNLTGKTVTLSVGQLSIDSKDIILDGDLNDDGVPDITISGNNTSQVIYTANLTAAARLEGLTICDGTATQGGGMYNSSSSPTITSCNFSGNTATGSGIAKGGGMYSNNSSPDITNCNFSGNTATGDIANGGGMYNKNSSPTITSCTFYGNSATGVNAWGGGMYNTNSSPTITNCIFSDNYATGETLAWGGGMYNYSYSPTITNCTFSGNTAVAGGGMYNEISSPTITNCILWGDSGGEIVGSVNVTYSNVGVTNPLFVDAAGGDFHLKSEAGHWTSGGWVTDNQTSPCIDAGNPLSACGNEPSPNGGRINMGAYGNTAQASKSLPSTLIVTTESDDGDNAIIGDSLAKDTFDGFGLSLREALHWAGAGGTVTFSSNLTGKTVTLSGDELSIESKDIILDGDLDDDGTPDITISGNSTSRVICTSNLTSTARLEGLYITGGNATFGGGMYNDSSSPTITNCTFNGNAVTNMTGTAYGGGMYNFNYSSPTIINCTFNVNSASGQAVAGGGMANVLSSPAITNCIFNGNSVITPDLAESAYGGGMCNFLSSPNITNCTFNDNSVITTDPAENAYGGGMYNEYSSPNITNCTFYGNSVTSPLDAYGGGMCNINSSSPNITNCTFNGNAADKGGGMHNLGPSSPAITNCILWGDTGGEICNSSSSQPPEPVVSYSDVAGNYTGTGNINADPLFFNAPGRDFHLLPTSPCIDSGNNTAPYLPATDFEGDARIMDGDGDGNAVVDMGVDETVYSPPPPVTYGEPGYYLQIDLLGTRHNVATSYEGRLDQTLEATSADGSLTVTIPAGTTARDKNGLRLTALSVTENEDPPPPPENKNIIGLTYNFEPDGATFDPPITLTFTYDPGTLPEGVAEEDLVLAFYNEDTGEWIELECVVDTENHTITALVSHFTDFAIIAPVPPPPPPPKPAPAAFSLSDLTVQPAEVEPGETTTVSVVITNTGGETGSYTAVLKINGLKEGEKTVTIAAGSSQTVSFSVTREEAGSYTVTSDGLSGSFTVVAPTAEEEEEVPVEVEEVPEIPARAPVNWGLIAGIIAAVIAAGLLVFFLLRRKRYV